MKNIAVIGLGSIAKRHRKNLKDLYPNARVYAMSSSGRLVDEIVDNCDEVVNSIERLIDIGVDFVVIASPATFHAQHSIPLIRSGIPVLIEKPVAASLEDARLIASETAKFGTPVAVGYCLRYMPSAQKMRDFIDRRQIGCLYNIAIEIGDFLPSWRPDKNYMDTVSASAHLGGGALLEMSHEIDYAHWMLGDINIRSALLSFSSELDLDVEDRADVLATTSRGEVLSLHLDFLQKSPFRQMRLVGEKGILKWDLLKNSIFSDDDLLNCVYEGASWDRNFMYLDMLKDFERFISNKSNKCISLGEGIITLGIIKEIRSSAIAVDHRV